MKRMVFVRLVAKVHSLRRLSRCVLVAFSGLPDRKTDDALPCRFREGRPTFATVRSVAVSWLVNHVIVYSPV